MKVQIVIHPFLLWLLIGTNCKDLVIFTILFFRFWWLKLRFFFKKRLLASITVKWSVHYIVKSCETQFGCVSISMIQCPPSGPVEEDDSFWLGTHYDWCKLRAIQNSLSLYNVHFFMFMGWDGGIINTMLLHMVKSDRGQNRGVVHADALIWVKSGLLLVLKYV